MVSVGCMRDDVWPEDATEDTYASLVPVSWPGLVMMDLHCVIWLDAASVQKCFSQAVGAAVIDVFKGRSHYAVT